MKKRVIISLQSCNKICRQRLPMRELEQAIEHKFYLDKNLLKGQLE